MGDNEEYKRKRNVVKEAIKKSKKDSWKKMGEEITELHITDTRKFWTRIKRIRGDKRKSTRAIKNKQGKIQIDTKEILETWKDFYENMYHAKRESENNIGREVISQEQAIKREEVKDAIQKIKIGKAGGEDGIAPEM